MNDLFKFVGMCLVTFLIILTGGMLAAKNPNVLMVFSFAAPIVLFIYPRITCTLAVYKMENDNVKGMDKILCYIPFYNTYFSRKLQYFRSPVVGGVLLYVLLEILVITPICRFGLAGSHYAVVYNVIVSWLNILAIILLWVVEAYVNVKLCQQIGYNALVLSIVLPPIASFFLARKITLFYMKNKHEIKGTFKGDKGIKGVK